MSFEELNKIINSQFSSSEKRYRFNSQPFNSKEIDDLLTSVIGQDTWELADVQGLQKDSVNNIITLSGYCEEFFQQQNAKLTMVFFLDEAASPQLLIKLHLEKNWSFTGTFDKLKKTVFAEISFTPENPPLYVFASVTYRDETLENCSFVTGMNFYSVIEIKKESKAFSSVQAMLGKSRETTAVGPITIENGVPNATLTLTFSHRNTLENFFSFLKTNVEIQLISQFHKDYGDITGIRLGTSFNIGLDRSLEISTVLNPWVLNELFFIGRFKNVNLKTLYDVIKGFGNLIDTDELSSLPDLSKYFSHFELQSLGLGLNTVMWKPSSICMGFGTSENSDGWVIMQRGTKSLALKKLQINIEKYIGDDAPGLFVSLNGQLNVLGVGIILAANNGNLNGGWAFAGNTEPATPIPIKKLIKEIAQLFGEVTLPNPIKNITIENLGISFNTSTKEFTFTCASQFPVDEGSDVDITITINITKQEDNTYTKHFDGHLTIAGLQFALIFESDKRSQAFLATYHDATGQARQVKNLVGAVSEPLGEVIPKSLTLSLQDALFAYLQKDTKKFIFGLDIGSSINLSQLPLIGKALPADQTLGVENLQLLIASSDCSAQEITAINTLLPEGVSKIPEPTSGREATEGTQAEAAFAKGVHLAATLKLGEHSETCALTIGTSSPQPVKTPFALSAPAAMDSATAENIKWFNIQKNLGPVHFERIGVQYAQEVLSFLLDGSFSVSGLTLSLEGLSVDSSLEEFTPKFNLRGLGLDYRNGPVEIGGSFLKGKEYDDYSGMAIIRTPALALIAMGSYVQLPVGPSLFVYAALNCPLGGPAFLFVTGLAAGFGYNRLLHPPSVDQINQFPLVKAAMGEGDSDLANMLADLQTYIPPSVGNYFLAVGIRFTSFKMIDSFVLVTAAFGHRFELNVLGLSTLVLPSPDAAKVMTPIAEVQLALRATFIPEDGFFGLSAQLTSNSFLLDRKCHLIGGFAFSIWFVGTHEGDFVLTMGGYHPRLPLPTHYPVVPRLGFNWQVSPQLTFKGGAYCALTPSCLMAGCALSAVWQDGRLQAWFNGQFDFLISWKPYHYEADLHLCVGATYTFQSFGTHKISADLDAELSLWGPEFAGRAHISWSVISFSIDFGAAGKNTLKPIDWEEFHTTLLPETVCTITLKDGLLGKTAEKEVSDVNDKGNTPEHMAIVNPKTLCLTTDSVIPVKKAELGAKEEKGNLFAIGSMQISTDQVDSTVSISIKYNKVTPVENNFDFQRITKNLPAALWGNRLKPSLYDEQMISNLLTGFEIRPKRQDLTTIPTTSIELAKLRQKVTQDNTVESAFKWTTLSSFAGQDDMDETTRSEAINRTICSDTVVPKRADLAAALGFDFTPDLQGFAADDFFVAPQVNGA